MAAGAFEADLAMPFGVAAKAGGALLLRRRWFFSSSSLVVPAGVGWISARGCGQGGQLDGSNNPGAGGAFARRDMVCSSGLLLEVSLDYPTTISLAGTVICKAMNAVRGTPGSASECIGDIVASGGSPGQPGTNGGVAGTPYNGQLGGGGSGGEKNASDALITGGDGGHRYSALGGNGARFGGGACYSEFIAFPGSSGPGVAVIELWSAKP